MAYGLASLLVACKKQTKQNKTKRLGYLGNIYVNGPTGMVMLYDFVVYDDALQKAYIIDNV